MENKLVTYKQLEIGQEINGIEESGRSSLFKAFAKDTNPTFVTVNMGREDGKEIKINSSAIVKIVGYSTDIIQKTSIFIDGVCDIGVCAEYKNGVRFWCHYRFSDIKKC